MQDELVELSSHAKLMITERGIEEKWVWRKIETPKRKRRGEDGNIHFTKPIKERNGRVLRVIVSQDVQPNRIITVFFDRRLR